MRFSEGLIHAREHGVRRVGITIFLSWLTLDHQVDYIELHSPADSAGYHTMTGRALQLVINALAPSRVWYVSSLIISMYLQGGFAELAKIVFGFFAGEVSLTSVAVRAIYSGSAENLFFFCSVN